MLVYFLITIIFVFLFVLHEKYNQINEQLKQLKKDIKEGINSVQYSSSNNIAENEIKSVDVQSNNSTLLEKIFIEEDNQPEDDILELQDQWHNEDIDSNIDRLMQESSKKQKISFEEFFLGNIFRKIGAFALVICVFIFVKLISTYVEFTPQFLVTTGFLFCFGLILFSIYKRKVFSKQISEALCGVGIGGCLISIYSGCSYHGIIPTPLALTLAFLMIFVSYYISMYYNSFSIFLIGLFGGYLNPFFCNQNTTPDFLMGYLIVVNLITMIYVYYNPKKSLLNLVNVFVTTLCAIIFSVTTRQNIEFVYPFLLWLIYFAYDFISLIIKKHTKDSNVLRWVNLIQLFCFANYIFKYDEKQIIATVLLFTAILYILKYLLLIFKYKIFEYRHPISLALASILLSSLYFFQGTALVSALSIELTMIAYLYSIVKFPEFKNYIYTYSGAIFVFLLTNFDILFNQNLNAFFNERLMIFSIPIIFLLLSSYRLRDVDKNIMLFLNYLNLTLVYIFLACELNCIFKGSVSTLGINSILASMYSVNILRFFKNFKITLILSNCLLIVAIIAFILQVIGFASNPSGVIIFNIHFLSGILLIFALMFKSKNDNNFYKYCAIVVAYLISILEFDLILHNFDLIHVGILKSAFTIVFAAILLYLGINKNILIFKKSGVVFVILSLIKIFLFDLANIDAIFKLIAFAILGVSLLFVSFYYSQKKIK